MKHRLITPAIVLFSMLLWTSSRADGDPLQNQHQFDCDPAEEIFAPLAEPSFDIKICLNVLFVQVCFTLRCDLHWTDILQPGLGQLLGHEGCKVIGQAASGENVLQFAGNAEDMIQSIETAMGVPKGSMMNLQVSQSPAFQLPDGKQYRVVAKTYQMTKDSDGRHLPLEVEVVE